jgi:hypothetical protein
MDITLKAGNGKSAICHEFTHRSNFPTKTAPKGAVCRDFTAFGGDSTSLV